MTCVAPIPQIDRRPAGKISLPDGFRLVLPREHGSWSLAFEPLALGWLVAPGAAGGALVLAVAAGFFLRRPLKIVFGDKPDSRRGLAWRCIVMLGLIALLALAGAVVLAPPRQLWPLVLALPFGVLFLAFDWRDTNRAAAAELAGTMAFALLPAAIASLAGWPPGRALTLAGVMLIRAVPTVLFVRSYLRRHKGRPAAPGMTLLTAAGALVLALVLTAAGLAPPMVAGFALLFLLRAGIYLSPLCPRCSARAIGMQEAVLGVIYVVVLGLMWPR